MLNKTLILAYRGFILNLANYGLVFSVIMEGLTMKTLLLMTTAAVAIAGAAQAEVSFVKGTASLDLSQINGSTFTLINSDADVAFSMGAYGFQIGAGMLTFTDGTDSTSISNSNAHVYRQAANGNKYGAYVSSMFFFTEYGVEGMFNLGPVDVEVYAGMIDDIGDSVAHVGIEAFFDVSEGIEVSAGYNTLFDTNGGGGGFFDMYSVGASYDIPNTNLAATASYETFDDGLEAIYGIGIEWSFGPNQGERMFGERNFPFFFGI